VTRLTITFDNGPTPGVTDRVLATLATRGIKSTFFLVGEKLVATEARDLAIAAHEQGHWIGNHTMHHGSPLGEWDDAEGACAEIALAQEALGALAHPRRLFRPNGRGLVGSHVLSSATIGYLAAHRYTVVLWSIFVRDSKSPDGWEQRALAPLGQREWDVLVLHDVPTSDMDVLPRFIDHVLDRGITIEQDFPTDLIPLEQGALTGAAVSMLPASESIGRTS
jgi:peptidoglycan/xylan/chitin deacetylase (PgdA/CDA1 family)